MKHATVTTYDNYDGYDKPKNHKSNATVKFANSIKFALGKPEYIHGLRLGVRSSFFPHWLFGKHARQLQILVINGTSGKDPESRISIRELKETWWYI